MVLVAHMCFAASTDQGVGVAIMDHDLETVVDTGGYPLIRACMSSSDEVSRRTQREKRARS